MEKLSEILKSATAGVSEDYFCLKIDHGGDDPIYRERVYCYELYHQLRNLWPSDTYFYLNGEIDKAAHPILKRLDAAYAKPDLLVHRPGYMEGNDTIIEVKSQEARNDGIEKDIKTLVRFRQNDIGYKRAIYLIYGYEAEDTAGRASSMLSAHDPNSLIELWVHTAPHQPAKQLPSVRGDEVIKRAYTNR